jgi:hypothetical protein
MDRVTALVEERDDVNCNVDFRILNAV